jgi:hypothetical protein
MDLRRLNRGERIATLSAILLFASMFFLTWFGAEVIGIDDFSGHPGGGGNAWHTLDLIRFVLLVTIVAGLAMAGLRLAGSNAEPLLPMSVLVTMLGVFSVLLILFRIIDPPAIASLGGVSVDATPRVGIFLGLIAAGGVAYGGYSTMREEGITFDDAANRLSSGGSPPRPPSNR